MKCPNCKSEHVGTTTIAIPYENKLTHKYHCLICNLKWEVVQKGEKDERVINNSKSVS
jgi:C4-type Zn-finger protein